MSEKTSHNKLDRSSGAAFNHLMRTNQHWWGQEEAKDEEDTTQEDEGKITDETTSNHSNQQATESTNQENGTVELSGTEELESEEKVEDETYDEVTTDIPSDNPELPPYGSDISIYRPLTEEQKERYRWDEVITQFKQLSGHSQVEEKYLYQWVRKQLSMGWQLNDSVPDLTEFRSEFGNEKIYQVTRQKVPTLYVYYYGTYGKTDGNFADVRRWLLYEENYDGFWVYVNSITGKESVLQQRDAFNKFYTANPVSTAEFSDLAMYMNHNGISSSASKVLTAESLFKLQSESPATFRKIIESVQLNLFGTKNIKGYGLYTASTRTKVQDFNKAYIQEKKTPKQPENLEMVFTEFKKPGIVDDSGSNVLNQEQSGAKLRSTPEFGDNVINWLPFNTRVYIQAKTSEKLGWYFVKTEFGEDGYVVQWLINAELPDPDARMYVVKPGDTVLGIARKLYSRHGKESMGQVQSAFGQDYRNYVNKLVQYNKNTPGIYYKGGKEWDNAELKAGMRIWIPSPMTMYEMVRSTSMKDLHGRSKYTNLAQDIFDYAPQNLLIHQLLELWRSIPAEDINKVLQTVDEVALYILKSLRIRNMEWLDAFLLAASPTGFATVKFLAFMREFTIGYIEYMHSLDAETRVKSMERFLFSYTQLDYFVGLFEGVAEGIKDWFKDIWGIVEGIFNFISKLPEYYKQIKEAFGEEEAGIIMNIIQFLQDPSSSDGIKDLLKNFNPLDIFTWMDAGIEKAGKSAGSFVGKEIIKMLNLTPIEVGRKVGWLIGYLIPEIILAIFSAGIGTAIKTGAQALAKAAKFIFQILGKAVRITIEAIKTAITSINSVLKSIKTMAALFAKKGNKQLSKFFEKLEELFKKFKEFLKKKQKTPNSKTIDELLVDGKVPSVRNNAFNDWFNKLSVEEFDKLWQNKVIREQIEARIRHPRGYHEWYKVSQTPKFKGWGVTMDKIKDFRTKIENLKWTHPVTKTPGNHGGHGSTLFHNELDALIESSKSLDDFHKGLGNLLKRWNVDRSVVPELK